MQLVQARVEELLARQRVQRRSFDPMNQLPRRAPRGNQVEPAPRAHTTFEPQDAFRNGIAMMKVVEEPTVELIGSQLSLYGLDLRHSSLFLAARRGRRCGQGPNLHNIGALNLDSLGPAALAGGDSNRRDRHVQTSCQKTSQSLVRPIVNRRSRQADTQRS